jgi:hypothetical protein
MNGYFTRLMEQSGISVEPTVEPGPEVLERHQNEPGERDTIASTDVEREEPIEFWRDELILERHQNEPGERDRMASTDVDREEPIEFWGDELIEQTQRGSEADSDTSGLHGKVPEAPRRRIEEGQQSRLPESRELDPGDSERTPPSREEAVGELPEEDGVVESYAGAGRPGAFGREAREQDETIEGTTHRADQPLSPSAEAAGETLAFEPGREPQDQTSRERVWQNTFREVREWVAGSPVADDKETENQGVSRARDTTTINTDSPSVEERVATSYPRATASSPREEPEARDLRLEIGTISVTVEAPQKEFPKKDSQRTETAEKKPARDNERSRLSRHYVRIR